MEITEVINNFSIFLNKSFDDILKNTAKIDKDRIFLADEIENGYLQFIWEILVEKLLCSENDYLDPYGDGADFYPLSSRVTYPDKEATKGIIVEIDTGIEVLNRKNVSNVQYDFVKFITYDGYYYEQKPPFEYVLCEDDQGEKKIFHKSNVRFKLIDIKNQ